MPKTQLNTRNTGKFSAQSPAQRKQVAALCYQGTGDDTRVLLITSRDTGRWVLPKGWPIDGLDAPSAALQEAWEEAGVEKASVCSKKLGKFDYDKRLRNDTSIPVSVSVFAARVKTLADTYPECNERTRCWVSPKKAASLVDEPELQELLSDFAA